MVNNGYSADLKITEISIIAMVTIFRSGVWTTANVQYTYE